MVISESACIESKLRKSAKGLSRILSFEAKGISARLTPISPRMIHLQELWQMSPAMSLEMKFPGYLCLKDVVAEIRCSYIGTGMGDFQNLRVGGNKAGGHSVAEPASVGQRRPSLFTNTPGLMEKDHHLDEKSISMPQKCP